MARRRRFLADRTATVIVVVRLLLALQSSSIPPFVAAQSFACVNTPDWKDLYGDTCVYYSSGPDRCEMWGGKGAGKMGVANDNCCVCGGGKVVVVNPDGGGEVGGTTTTATTQPVDINLAVVDDVVVLNPDGTCGKGGGDRGNGICPDGRCCSRFGWCGDTPDHCQSIPPTPEPTLSPITPIPTDFPTYAPVTGTPTISSMPSFDYDDPQAWNHGTYAVASEKGENVEVKLPPATMVGDTLFLFVSRTDAYMSIRLDGWTTGASCFKTYNDQPTCLLASDCVEKDGDDCLLFQGDGIAGGGYDLGTVLFHRRVTEDDLLSGTLQTIVEGTDNRRTWAIVTAITNVNQQSPIRAAAGTACDEDSDSVFPSVYGKDNDVLLLSQSFDDTASRDDFLPPDGTFLLGRAISRDEFGILFGEKLDRSGETAKRVTGGQGGSKCKDALLAIVVNREPLAPSQSSIQSSTRSTIPPESLALSQSSIPSSMRSSVPPSANTNGSSSKFGTSLAPLLGTFLFFVNSSWRS